ncbi:MAG: hypothetical protein AAGI03_00610 [Pseudomonadota bacterium]
MPDTLDAMAAYPGKKWTVRQRQWPNGRAFYVVGIGPKYGITVANRKGNESRFYDRSQAQRLADDLNGKTKKADDSLIEE